MKKWWKVLLAVAVIVIVVTTVVSVAVAWPSGGVDPMEKSLAPGSFNISGTFAGLAGIDDPKPKTDGNTMTMLNVGYNQVHGSLEGIVRTENVVTLDLTTGKFTFVGIEYFTGTLNGVAGTLLSKETGSGQFFDATGQNWTGHGEATFVAGTGGLAHVTGGGISYDTKVTGGVESPTPYGGTYEVTK